MHLLCVLFYKETGTQNQVIQILTSVLWYTLEGDMMISTVNIICIIFVRAMHTAALLIIIRLHMVCGFYFLDINQFVVRSLFLTYYLIVCDMIRIK